MLNEAYLTRWWPWSAMRCPQAQTCTFNIIYKSILYPIKHTLHSNYCAPPGNIFRPWHIQVTYFTFTVITITYIQYHTYENMSNTVITVLTNTRLITIYTGVISLPQVQCCSTLESRARSSNNRACAST